MHKVAVFLLVASMTVLLPLPGASQPGDAQPGWTFTTDRPVKAMVVGGSIAAFVGAGFGDQLQAACRNLEVVNLARARDSAAAVRQRFQSLVLDNPNLGLGTAGERWIFVHGGLNSVGNPHKTNADILDLFRAAHGAGLNVFGLTLSPWGSEKDVKRWKGYKGVGRQDNTRRAVDFVMGRLTPAEALGRHANGQTAWKKGDLPTLAVDLYDSALRDRKAALRAQGPLAAEIDRDPDFRKRIAALPASQQSSERTRILKQAREIPRWFLRPELQSFDHIHPNREGHRLIAVEMCAKAPGSWGCDCSLLKAPAARQATPVR
jgi:hypothetical protein